MAGFLDLNPKIIMPKTTMQPAPVNGQAEQEKKRAALSSVLAAFFLTGLKLTVGIFTNSLGILAEAAHSALDLIAAAVTFMAVRVSSRPADQRHAYGHGKVENLAALVETLLLLATCGWIVQEAIDRLLYEHDPIRLSGWAFLVMIISIVVDFSRSRMLSRVAKKHKSQALEADALHFSTDILSSMVVLAGLGAVWLADFFPAESFAREALLRADAVAALVVAVIVAWVSLRLGKKAVDTLLDASSTADMKLVEEAALSVPGVKGVKRLRLRESGPAVFVDMQILLPASSSLEFAHSLTEQVEKAVQKALPEADLTIHFEPEENDRPNLMSRVRQTAFLHGLDVHAINIYNLPDGNFLSLHAALDGDTALSEAHRQADAFEQALDAPGYEILTHLEPRHDSGCSSQARLPELSEGEQGYIHTIVGQGVDAEPGVSRFHKLHLLEAGGEWTLTLHCCVSGDTSVMEAHAAASRIEAFVLERLPRLKRVIIHTDVAENTE